MPKIINAYSGNESIAENLKGLGQAMFGDGARNEVLRQQADKLKRENESVEPYSEAAANNDRVNMARYGIRANREAHVPSMGLFTAGTAAGENYNDPRLAVGGLAAGHSAESTMPGLQQTIAQRAAAAHEATQRAAQTQESIAQRQLEADARKPASLDQVKAAVVQREMGMGPPPGRGQFDARFSGERPQQVMQPGAPEGFVNPSRVNGQPQNLTGDIIPPGGTNAAPQPPPAAPMAPQATGYVHPLVQEALGYPRGAAPYQHLATGAVGQSYDGGKTIDGHPAGEGWVAVTPQEAINRTRENQQVEQAHRPLSPAPTQVVGGKPQPVYPQAAVDAAATSGIKAAVQHEANNMWGSLGGGEVGANTNRARENLGLLASQARTVLATTPGHQSNQAQRWADELVPHPGFLGVTAANPDEAKNRVMSLIAHMRQLHELEGQEAAQTADPALRNALLAHRTRLEQTITMYEKGVQSTEQPNLGPKPVQTQSVRAPQADESSRGLFTEPAAAAPASPQQPAAPADHVIDPKTGQQLKWTGYIWTPVQ